MQSNVNLQGRALGPITVETAEVLTRAGRADWDSCGWGFVAGQWCADWMSGDGRNWNGRDNTLVSAWKKNNRKRVDVVWDEAVGRNQVLLTGSSSWSLVEWAA
ncbi:MAG: hypothetical protein GY743_18375, partial [Planctomycetaceae bacterium]|nr:hypothetical protein [Planctomycetaceae bacterium]